MAGRLRDAATTTRRGRRDDEGEDEYESARDDERDGEFDWVVGDRIRARAGGREETAGEGSVRNGGAARTIRRVEANGEDARDV